MSAHAHFLQSLEEQATLFEERARKASKQTSISRVHGLRVVSRRLRAFLWLIPKDERTRPIRKTIRNLKALTGVLGEQRTFDIALKDAISFSRNTEEIERRRSRAKTEVSKALSKSKRRKYSKHLRAAVKVIRKYPWETFVPRMTSLKHSMDRAQTHPPKGDAAGHNLRIRAKKTRYVLEALGTPMTRLDQLQDHLGRWHDLIVLDELTGHSPAMLQEKNKEWETSQRMLKPTLASATHALDSVLQSAK